REQSGPSTPPRRGTGRTSMRPDKGLVWGCALAALALIHSPARAAWNNVFQVCCAHCRSAPAPAVAMYAAPALPASPAPCGPQPCPQPRPQPSPPPCPQTICTTRYVQRCYYQPVTTYRVSTYLQPVTTYRKSYYYEPCTSYRYSCYF